jgi:hypothetical protein
VARNIGPVVVSGRCGYHPAISHCRQLSLPGLPKAVLWTGALYPIDIHDTEKYDPRSYSMSFRERLRRLSQPSKARGAGLIVDVVRIIEKRRLHHTNQTQRHTYCSIARTAALLFACNPLSQQILR